MQGSLFSNNHQSSNEVTNLLPKDGEVLLYPNVIQANYAQLKEEIDWQHEKIYLFGRWVLQPRLTAWYGDEGTEYEYSGLKNTPKAWTHTLLSIKSQVEVCLGQTFNSVLANCYRDGQDSMGWHQDNEKALGNNPIIASVSLGGVRKFQLRHKTDKSMKNLSIPLESGSLLVMQGTTQNFWQHQVPKTKKHVNERINLTFRNIIN